MNDFFKELKRRNVVRVGVAYAVVSWVILQFVDIIQDIVAFPGWFPQMVLVLLIIGLPIALLLSWAYEVTPEGVKKTEEVDKSKSIAHGTGQRINKLIIGGLVLAVAFLLYDKFMLTPDTPVMVEAKAGPVSIAVLPFADLSQAGDQEYFGDGVAEEILNILAGVEGLDVTSRTTAFSLKGRGLTIPEMADRLGVSHIVEGSIRSANNQVRVTAQLIRTDTDTHLWSETYDRDLTDIFAIQDDISRAITNALQLELFGDGAVRENPTDNLEAYQLYLKGHHFIMLRGVNNLNLAKERLEQAVELDPEFAMAWADLAVATLLIPAYSANVEQQPYLDQAGIAADRALEINPDLAQAVLMKGFIAFHEKRWLDSVAPMKKATQLDPKNETIWLWNAVHLSSLGYLEDALVAAKKAYEIAPTTGINAGWVGFIQGFTGNKDEARRYLGEAIVMRWNYANARMTELSLSEGDLDEAKLFIQEFLTREGEPENSLDTIIDAYGDPTLKADARAIVMGYLEERRYYSSLYGSFILGDADLIVEYFETLSNNHGPELGFTFAPAFRKIFNDPIFQDYLRKIGLVGFWRENGWPDSCRPVGDEEFECDE